MQLLTGDLNRYHQKLKTQSNNLESSKNFNILTFYKFVDNPIDSGRLQSLRDVIYDQLKLFNIKGTILIATEGINGTISSSADIDIAFDFIQAQPELGEIFGKYSTALFDPFRKLKIKVRPEIVTMGIEITNKLNVPKQTGEHIDAIEWNNLLKDPDTIVIDTRNDFEYQMGTFKNSVNPNTKTFRNLPEYIANNLDVSKNKQQKIAMFCTGGVRCEKSTAYLKDLGFENVYQLNGGILNYFKDIQSNPTHENMWEGRCFVFDDRIAVDASIQPVGIPEDYVNYGRRDLMPKDEEY